VKSFWYNHSGIISGAICGENQFLEDAHFTQENRYKKMTKMLFSRERTFCPENRLRYKKNLVKTFSLENVHFWLDIEQNQPSFLRLLPFGDFLNLVSFFQI